MRKKLPTLTAAALALLTATQPALGVEPGGVPPATSRAGDALAQAVAHLQRGDRDAALAVLEPLRADSAAAPQTHALLGALYVEAGRFADGLAVLGPLAAADGADPVVLYNAGRAAVALGRAGEAEALLARAVAAAPRSPAARELGLLHGRQGRMFDAYRLLRPWALAHAEDAEARMAAAQAAVDLGRPVEAKALLADLDAGAWPARVLLAEVARLESEPARVVETLSAKPGDVPPEGLQRQVLWLLADAFLALGQSKEAADLLRPAAPIDARLCLLFAQALYQGGQLEAALAALDPWVERTMELSAGQEAPPGRAAAPILLEAGRMLVAAGRMAEAVLVLERAVKLAPGSRQGWQSLGRALVAVGRREEAQAALARFQQLAAQEPSQSQREARLQLQTADPTAASLARALEAHGRGETAAALDVVRREAELVPEDPRPGLLAARILLEARRLDEALAAADAVARRSPRLADAFHRRGQVHLAREETAAAEADLRRALELAPQHLVAMNDLALLLMARGETAEARALLERVLAFSPDDELARASLEKLQGRPDAGSPPG